MNARDGSTRLIHAIAAVGSAALLAACSPEPMESTSTADTPAAAPMPSPVAAEPRYTYIKSSHSNVGDQFGGGGAAWGYSLAFSADGQTLAVGARMEDSSATGVGGDPNDNSVRDSGAAYVYSRTPDGSWAEQAYLKASNTGAGDMFGYSMAISRDGNTLAITASAEDGGSQGINGSGDNDDLPNSGAVYLFTRQNGTWSQQAYVKASNAGEAEDGDTFGYHVALSGDGSTLAVTANGEDSAATGVNGDQTDNSSQGSGAVYVFVRDGDTWVQQAYVKPSNTGASDLFGSSVALNEDGSVMAVGSLDEDGGSRGPVGGDPSDNSAGGAGAVYVFTRENGSWRQQAYVKSEDMERGDALGTSVALNADGTTLVSGAIDEDSLSTGVNGDTSGDPETDTSTGAAYVFVRSGDTWSQQAYLKPSNTGLNDQFGVRLALSDDGSALAVGTPLEDGSASGINGIEDDAAEDAGAVYLFRRSGTQWSQTAYIKASATQEYDEFGATVAMSGDGTTLVVGARGEDSGAAGINGDQSDNSVRDAGAVYVLEPLPR
jgi:hypothetical protein